MSDTKQAIQHITRSHYLSVFQKVCRWDWHVRDTVIISWMNENPSPVMFILFIEYIFCTKNCGL